MSLTTNTHLAEKLGYPRIDEITCGRAFALAVGDCHHLRRKLAAGEGRYGRSDFERRHFALLALSSAAFMAAVALGQALIALSSQAHLALAWAGGVATFAVVTALGNDLYLRVELGLVTGTGAVALLLGVLLAVQLRRAVDDLREPDLERQA